MFRRKGFSYQEDTEGNIPKDKELWGFYKTAKIDVQNHDSNGDYSIKFKKGQYARLTMRENALGELIIQIEMPDLANVRIQLNKDI